MASRGIFKEHGWALRPAEKTGLIFRKTDKDATFSALPLGNAKIGILLELTAAIDGPITWLNK
jgi:hypothetical protein